MNSSRSVGFGMAVFDMLRIQVNTWNSGF
jgi:hypothetical protein